MTIKALSLLDLTIFLKVMCLPHYTARPLATASTDVLITGNQHTLGPKICLQTPKTCFPGNLIWKINSESPNKFLYKSMEKFLVKGPPSVVLGPWHGLVKARQVALPLHRWFDSLGQSSEYSGQRLPGKQEGSRIPGILLVNYATQLTPKYRIKCRRW